MRILFLPLITRGKAIGTITRCLAIADHLRQSGHESLFLTNGEGAKFVSEAGHAFVEGTLPDPPGAYHPLRNLADVAAYLNLTREHYIREAIESERRAIDIFKPDVLFSEFKLTASISAALMGLPLVSTACSPADPRFRSPLFPTDGHGLAHQFIGTFNRVLEQHRLAPIEDVTELFFTRSQVKIAPTVPEIEPLLADVPGLYYVGYLLDDRMELAPLPKGLIEQAKGRCVVFVYLSTGAIGPERYIRILPQAFDGTELYAIVAVGDHPDVPELPSDTQNTAWVRFVPGRSLMKCCEALIFHGGQNTAMAALIHKLPSLVFPGTDFERDFNARSLARTGAAIHLPVEEFIPDKLLQSTRLLREPSYHLAAAKYSSKILQHGGPQYAADLVARAGRGLLPEYGRDTQALPHVGEEDVPGESSTD